MRTTILHSESGRILYESDRETGCDSEVAAMLDYVAVLTSCDAFIGIYPEYCMERVLDGISDSYLLYRHGIRTCISLACPTDNVFSEQDLIAKGYLAISSTR